MCVDSPRKSHRPSPEGTCGQFCLKKHSQEFLSSSQSLGMRWGGAGRGGAGQGVRFSKSGETIDFKDQEVAARAKGHLGSLPSVASRAEGADGENRKYSLYLSDLFLLKRVS